MFLEGSILAAFGAMFFWGIGDFFIQRSTRKIGDLESLAFMSIVGAVGLLPFAIKELPRSISVQNIALLSFIGILIFFNGILGYEALKKGKLSIVEIIFGLEVPMTVILGVLFFKETLSLLQIGAISLVFIGTLLISASSVSRKHLQYLKNLEKGVLLAFLSAIGMALAGFFSAVGSRQISPLMVVWASKATVAIICLFIIWRMGGLHSLLRNALRFKFIILGMAASNALAWIFYTTSVVEQKLAIVIAIAGGYPAVAFLLGVCINKEKIRMYQYLGAAVALLASFSMAFLA